VEIDLSTDGGPDRRSLRARSSAGGPAPSAGAATPPASKSLSPRVLSYVVAPLALGVLVMFRQYGLVDRLPVWTYLLVIGASVTTSIIVEPWHSAPPGSLRRHGRLAAHILSVTAVIYMTGWGPVLGMAYAFVALQELDLWGSSLWKPVLWWSLANIAVAQCLLWFGLIPSFLSRGQAEAVGTLGAMVLIIVVRMAGATGEKKERAESLLAHQALHDMLTGLPNRAYFYERTEEALARSSAEGRVSAVMLFDLDRFKEINDTMGHRYGDRVLIEVGPRVGAVLRGGDTLARLGGDEFCVLLPSVADEATAVQVAERIIAVLEEPFDVDGTLLGIEASCGISLAPRDGETADLLLQRADVAMYVAKESQASVKVYTEDLNVNTPARLALLGQLRTAITRNQFVLHYQPKAAMETGRVEGAEALIRWQHPTLGLLSPDAFIPEAERTGLIEPMTVWVLNEALRQCRRWMDAVDPDHPGPLSVAVNLSAHSLLDVDLPDTVAAALAQWEVPAHLLELEITETIIMTDPKRSRRVLSELADMGVTLSIDDFGTGYSSLAYLRDLPVHQLKIDRTFVQDMDRDADNAVIVRSVVDLARNLGLCTVAEGVENASTWDQLTELGCTSAQGYFLARPMEAGLFGVWCREHLRHGLVAGAGDPASPMTGGALTVVRAP
jgi:diguanylate cyclase (GGDEF)-like protein